VLGVSSRLSFRQTDRQTDLDSLAAHAYACSTSGTNKQDPVPTSLCPASLVPSAGELAGAESDGAAEDACI